MRTGNLSASGNLSILSVYRMHAFLVYPHLAYGRSCDTFTDALRNPAFTATTPCYLEYTQGNTLLPEYAVRLPSQRQDGAVEGNIAKMMPPNTASLPNCGKAAELQNCRAPRRCAEVVHVCTKKATEQHFLLSYLPPTLPKYLPPIA